MRSWASEARNRVRIDHIAALDVMEGSIKVAEHVSKGGRDWNATGRKWWRSSSHSVPRVLGLLPSCTNGSTAVQSIAPCAAVMHSWGHAERLSVAATWRSGAPCVLPPCPLADLITSCDAKLVFKVPRVDDLLAGNLNFFETNPSASLRLTSSAGTLLPVGGASLTWQCHSTPTTGRPPLLSKHGPSAREAFPASEVWHKPCFPCGAGSYTCFTSACVAADVREARLGGGAAQPQYRLRVRMQAVVLKPQGQGSSKPACWPWAAPMGVPTPLLEQWDPFAGGLLPQLPSSRLTCAGCRSQLRLVCMVLSHAAGLLESTVLGPGPQPRP